MCVCLCTSRSGRRSHWKTVRWGWLTTGCWRGHFGKNDTEERRRKLKWHTVPGCALSFHEAAWRTKVTVRRWRGVRQKAGKRLQGQSGPHQAGYIQSKALANGKAKALWSKLLEVWAKPCTSDNSLHSGQLPCSDRTDDRYTKFFGESLFGLADAHIALSWSHLNETTVKRWHFSVSLCIFFSYLLWQTGLSYKNVTFFLLIACMYYSGQILKQWQRVNIREFIRKQVTPEPCGSCCLFCMIYLAQPL